VAEYPRQTGLKKYLDDLMVSFCVVKPQVTYSTPAGDWGEKYVEGYTRVGNRPIDIMERVLSDT
jgi:hypothetical protein